MNLYTSFILFLPFLFVVNNSTCKDINAEKDQPSEFSQNENYPYWKPYHKTPVSDIKPAKWFETDTIITGWDWSLPRHVKPLPIANLCIARNFGLGQNKIAQLPEVNFPSNPVISHWVNWRLLEPKEGEINFQPLIDNIKMAAGKGYGSIVRLHFSAIDFAPEWIKKYNIPIRKERKENPIKTNYDPGHPEFHKRYIKFIKALGESSIPHMEEVKGLFLGYASPSNGDEGIGPYPENGKFEFKKEIGDKLELLDQNDFNTFLMVWVAFATTQVSETDTSWAFTPRWLFKNGVPLVEMEETINPLGVKTRRDSPYYFDEDYKFFFHRMIDSLGNYICNLPPHLKKRILFLQSAEGSTGDGQPYKGSPVNPIYDITKEQWSQFRIETWEKYKSAFTKDGELQLPLLTNYDSNEEEQYRWMLDSLPKALGLKNGMFSHGYHISDAQQRLANFNAFREAVKATGKTFFARGEQDAEWKTYGWSTQNPKQGFYWSALYATHCGLSLWNVPWEACQGETYADAINLFNRYAAETNPNTAKGAFCALRRGLDASDTEAFPENIYGEAVKSNTQRYIDIANAFSEYGANQGDPEKATGGGMINRKREDYNDAGWKILKGNYQRHITQIDPEETSIAWWQVDTSIYGRFARGFDTENGKDTLFFDLDDKFFGNQFLNGRQEITVELTHLDSDAGSWKLMYDAEGDSFKTAMEITNTGSGGWKTKTVTLNDAYLANRGQRGADFILVNTGGTNCRFHMLAIDKVGKNDFPVKETTRSTWQTNTWQFPGDTLLAWQYDEIQNESGVNSFALDSGQTIGIYGCEDNSGSNVRSYNDVTEIKDAAQFYWDNITQTFKTNGQWVEYSVIFDIDEPYQLLIRAKDDVDANFKLNILNPGKELIFFKDISLKNDFENLGGGNDQTDWFLSNFAITDLWGAYMLRFDWYDNIGEPGVFGEFSFVKSVLDITPPEWYFVSIGEITIGANISVMTTEASTVYLVPADTPSNATAIKNEAIALVDVAAYSQEFFSTTEL